jgi:hypothetical protein
MQSPASLPAEAVYDYFFLVSRGYSEVQASSIVRARYGLGDREVRLLKRCVHPPQVNSVVKAHHVELSSGSSLCIDGFNQALTLYSARYLGYVYRCTDGYLRDDLSGAILKDTSVVLENMLLLINVAKRLKPSSVTVVLDSRVPRSGEIASKLRSYGVNAYTARKADVELVSLSPRCVVASSDIVILRSVPQHTDLVAAALKHLDLRGHVKVIDMARMVSIQHTMWCKGL